MKKQKIINIVLAILTIFSPMIAFSLACNLGEVEVFGIGGAIRYCWIMWLFVPICMVLFVLGIKLKKVNCKIKLNS